MRIECNSYRRKSGISEPGSNSVLTSAFTINTFEKGLNHSLLPPGMCQSKEGWIFEPCLEACLRLPSFRTLQKTTGNQSTVFAKSQQFAENKKGNCREL